MIEALPDDLPVYGLRASDVNEAYPETVEELAEQYLLEIQGVQPHGTLSDLRAVVWWACSVRNRQEVGREEASELA